MFNFFSALYTISFLGVPLFAHAAPANFQGLVTIIVGLVNNALVPLIFAVALLTFLLGVFRYFFSPESTENIKTGRQVVIWGIITIAVMVSIWGILNMLSATFF
jgi:hypothetical protein